MSEIAGDFGAWLERLSSQPLPGGVAAAALSAAMGAALIAKAARLALAHRAVPGPERARVESTLELADAKHTELVNLASADEHAYRAVLAAEGGPARRQAWQSATESPLQVAEACCLLLERMPVLAAVCPRSVRVDLEIGGWLLETGMRSGLRAAKANLKAWSDGTEFPDYRARIDALQEGEID